VETYVRHLEQAGYAPNTICQRIATLSSFYRWTVGEGHLAANPGRGGAAAPEAGGVRGERLEPP
jgi:site-specific recombinase XerD